VVEAVGTAVAGLHNISRLVFEALAAVFFSLVVDGYLFFFLRT